MPNMSIDPPVSFGGDVSGNELLPLKCYDLPWFPMEGHEEGDFE